MVSRASTSAFLSGVSIAPRRSGWIGQVALLLLLFATAAAWAQDFRIQEILRLPDGRVRLKAEASAGDYHILLQGADLNSVATPVAATLGVELTDLPGAATRFYRVQRVPLSQPLDLDRDGINDVFELQHGRILDPLEATDALLDSDDDGDSNLAEFQRGTDPESGGLARLAAVSPRPGETGVSVTRETILRFTRPLAADTALSAGNFFAEAAGRRLLTRAEFSSDRRQATLFYLEPVPANALVRVSLLGGGLRDTLNLPVDLDEDGLPGGDARIQFSTLTTSALPGTAVIGRVFASEPLPGAAGFVNQPLAGVTITVDGSEEGLRTTTDAEGRFTLSPCPPGRFFVHVDGRTAEGSAWPDGPYYPFVGKAWDAVPGVTANLAGGTGEIFLPLIKAGTLQEVSATQPTVVTFPAAVLAANPGLAGVSVTVPPNALFGENGTRGGRVGIAPVAPDRLPEKLPPGLNPPLVITVQTDGPQNFDQPVPVRFPNLPDPVTGERLPPGAKTGLWSFNHDTGRWELQGQMTVSADGLFADSNPGVGILQPGWHVPYPGPGSRGPGYGEDDDDGGGGGGGGGGDGPCAAELANLESAKAQWVIGAGLGLLEVAPGVGCAISVGAAIGGYAYDCERDPGNCTLQAAVISTIGAGIGCIPVVGAFGGPIWTGLTGVGANWANYQICLDAEAARNGTASRIARQGLPTIETNVFNEQAALFGAAAEVFGKVVGNTNWTYVTPAEYTLAEDIFQKLVDATAPGSESGELLSGNERTALLALPRPSNLTPADVTHLLDRYAGLQDRSLTLSAAELRGIGEAATNLVLVAEELQRRGWQTTQDAYVRALERPQAAIIINGSGTSGRIHPAAVRRTAVPELPDPDEPQPGDPVLFRLTEVLSGTTVTGRLDDIGSIPQQILIANRLYVADYYNLRVRRVATSLFFSTAAGTVTQIPAVRFFPKDQPDDDLDGLPDIAERIVGTDPRRFDTDGDGVSDGAEVDTGTDPAEGGVVRPTGIVATAATGGTAMDVAVNGDLAVVADGAAGLAVFSLRAGGGPVRLAQLDTPGNSVAVAWDSDRVAVADGSSGVVLMDLSTPASPVLLRQIAVEGGLGSVSRVALADGVIYAGAGPRGLYVLDAADGSQMAKLTGFDQVDDVKVAGNFLYLLTATELRIYRSALLGLELVGQVAVPLAPLIGESGRRFSLSGDRAYVGTRGGYQLVDISQPQAPVLLASPPAGIALPAAHGVAHDGTRTLASVDQPSGRPAEINLNDTADGGSVTNRIANFPAVAQARALAWHRGRLLAACGSFGLQVLQVLPPDTAGQPPSFSRVTLVEDTDPTKPGVQAVRDSMVRPRFAVTDDRQVARVELLLNGRVANVATAGPFGLAAPLTPAVSGGALATLRLRATDAAGNTAMTEEVMVELVAGSPGPAVLSAVPAEGAVVAPPGLLRLLFDRPLTGTNGLQLFGLGGDGQPGGGDDRTFKEWNATLEFGGRMLRVRLGEVLPAGGYALMHPGGRLSFTVGEPDNAVHWLSDADGNWSDATKWSGGKLPGPTSYVIIDRPGADPVVTLNVNATIAGIRSVDPLDVSERSLTIAGNGASELKGRALLRRGAVTVKGDGASLTVRNVTELVSSSLIALEGARITAPALVSWTPAGNGGGELRAEGPRSALDLPALATIEGPQGGALLILRADKGGRLNLPVFGPLATGRLELRALNNGLISAPRLNALVTDPVNSDRRSELQVGQGGVLEVGRMTNLTGVHVIRGENSVFDVGSLTVAVNCFFGLGRGGAEFNGLASASQLSVSATSIGGAGSVVTFPALREYRGGGQWSSAGEGALLIFPVLASLAGPDDADVSNVLNVGAVNGGVVELPSVVGEVTGRVSFEAGARSARVTANRITRMTGTGQNPGRIGASAGQLELNGLTQLVNVEVHYPRSGTLKLPRLTELSGGALVASDRATPDLSQFTRLTDVSLVAAKGATLTVPASTEVRLDGSVTPGGLVSWLADAFGGGGKIVFAPRSTGIVDAGPGTATLAIRATFGGVVDLSGVPSLPHARLQVETPPTQGIIDLSGLATIDGAAGSSVRLGAGIVTGGIVRVGGTVRLNPGTVVAHGVEFTVQPMSVLSVGTLDLRAGSVLTGVGTLTGSVVNSATVRPGAPVGLLTVTGDYVQTDAGTLEMELATTDGGTGHDQLVADGLAQLNGRLAYVRLPGFSAPEGSLLSVLKAASFSGTFGQVVPVDFPPDSQLEIGYLADQVRLTKP